LVRSKSLMIDIRYQHVISSRIAQSNSMVYSAVCCLPFFVLLDQATGQINERTKTKKECTRLYVDRMSRAVGYSLAFPCITVAPTLGCAGRKKKI
jgi:hypothetical protein